LNFFFFLSTVKIIDLLNARAVRLLYVKHDFLCDSTLSFYIIFYITQSTNFIATVGDRMFTVGIEHNVRFFVFERRRVIFLRSELEMDKNGRDGSTRRLCGESQPRFIFVRCIFIGASIMHPSDCQRAVTTGARGIKSTCP
jgi:hypothetical protein